jgi:hypothetical protein
MRLRHDSTGAAAAAWLAITLAAAAQAPPRDGPSGDIWIVPGQIGVSPRNALKQPPSAWPEIPTGDTWLTPGSAARDDAMPRPAENACSHAADSDIE